MTATETAIIQKAQYVRAGPFPMISGVIVKWRDKFRFDPDYKPAPLLLPLLYYKHQSRCVPFNVEYTVLYTC